MSQIKIGDILRRHRLEPQFIERDPLTQKELADMIGCHNSVVSRVERGDQWPTQEYLQRFIEVMQLPAEEAHKIWASYRPDTSPVSTTLAAQIREDWGEALDVVFYGRQAELTQLQQWLLTDRCRLVAVLGLGGIGKTALVTTLAKQFKTEFEYILWRSLRNAPPIAELLAEGIKFFSNQQQTDLPPDISKRITLLIEYLRRQRCLLVLDNVETILRSDRTGYYLDGYEGYGDLIQRVGHTDHQSCLLLTSREKPKELTDVYSKTAPIRLLPLGGLPTPEGREILADMELSGSDNDLDTIIQRYAGSPLALKLVSATIQALYGGNIAAFLRDATTAVGYVRDPLEQQFARLSGLEREVIYWLAIEREPVLLTEIGEDLVHLESSSALLEAVGGLHNRSMVETSSGRFTLHPVVMEYATEQLIDRVCAEIRSGALELFQSHSLILAQAKEYIRQSQTRLLLKPVAEQLLASLGREEVEHKLGNILSLLREQPRHISGYAGGNTLNLLQYMKSDLSQFDFSHIAVRQAYLAKADLRDVDFSYARLAKSVFTGTFGAVASIAFSPSGELLAAGTEKGEIRLWQVINGEPFMTLTGHSKAVRAVAFSPDGASLASGSGDYTIKLWAVNTGECLKTLWGHEESVWSVTFHPAGKILASGSRDGMVRLWDVPSGQCFKVLTGHTDMVWVVAFSPGQGSKLASGGRDNTIRVWDIDTGQHLTLAGHQDSVLTVAFHPNRATLASGSADHTIKFWEANTGQYLKTLTGHSGVVWSVAFNQDGSMLASGSRDQTVRLWNTTNYHCLNTLFGHADAIWAMTFSPHGHTLASGSRDQSIRLWDIQSGQCIKSLQGYADIVWCVRFRGDGQLLASGSGDQSIRLWDAKTGECLKTLLGHSYAVWSVAFSPDGHFLASGSADRTIRLWNLATGKCFLQLEGHTNIVRSVVFSPDGKLLASGSRDQTVRLWDAISGQCLNVIKGHRNQVRSVAISPDGRLLASGGSDYVVRLWDIKTGECLTELSRHNGTVFAVAFSSDGKLLASGSGDRTIHIWDTDGNHLKTLTGHSRTVYSLAFKPDDDVCILASGSGDRTIRIWDVNSDECLNTLEGHTSLIWSVDFDSQTGRLVSGRFDETIRFWDITIDQCLDTLRPDRPYERMNITGVTGLTEAQKASLKALGAIEMDGEI